MADEQDDDLDDGSGRANMGDSFNITSVLALHFGAAVNHGAEVGVYRGETSAKLLHTFPDLHLFMVDPWAVYASSKNSYRKSGDKCARFTAAQQQENCNAAHAATKFAAKRRDILRTVSVAGAHIVFSAGQKLDFAFIDGDHTLEAVRADIASWWPTIRPGGLLMGHDYGHPRDLKGIWGVKQAVDEFAAAKGLQVVLQGTVWSIVVP